MVERIEHLHPELHFHLFGNRECLDKTKIEVPVTRGDEGIPTDAVFARCGKAKCHCWVDSTGVGLAGSGVNADWFE